MPYPVQLDVASPPRYDRVQLALRLVLSLALGWLGVTAGWLWCLLFLALPVIAAVVISTRGSGPYVADFGPQLWRALSWLIAFSAYMLLLTDRFPTRESGEVRAVVQIEGQPTIGSALFRLILSIPSALVLAVLGFVSWILVIAGAVMILIEYQVPAGILGFQRGVLRWQARLLAYHASLVDAYPPFSFDDGSAHPDHHASAL